MIEPWGVMEKKKILPTIRGQETSFDTMHLVCLKFEKDDKDIYALQNPKVVFNILNMNVFLTIFCYPVNWFKGFKKCNRKHIRDINPKS